MIPVSMPNRENKSLATEINLAFQEFLESGTYVLGHQVRLFEEEFSSFIGSPNCVSVANGTDALRLAMQGIGLERGDKIALAANSGAYGAIAALSLGLNLEYFDVSGSGHLDIQSLVELLSLRSMDNRPKAIIYTHLFGGTNLTQADVENLGKLGVRTIEDCAQSAGLTIEGKRSGTLGDVATFSFYPTKNLGALGDGGAVVTAFSEVAEKVRQLRQYGWSNKYTIEIPGGSNSRLDEIQAAFLRCKLRNLDRWNERRSEYVAHVIESSGMDPFSFASSRARFSVHHLFVVDTDSMGVPREQLAEYLFSKGVATGIHYPIPDHKQPGLEFADGLSLKETERQAKSFLTLPMSSFLSQAEVRYIGESIRGFPH